MLRVGASTCVFVYRIESDMRWSFERLSGVVSQGMRRDPLSGDLFVFLNRKRDSMKVLSYIFSTPTFSKT